MHALVYEVRLVSPSVSGGKFWEARLFEDSRIQVCFGALRSSGQTQEKRFADRHRAFNYLDTKIQEKKRKGYQLERQKYASSPTPAPASKPAVRQRSEAKPSIRLAEDNDLALRWDF